MVRITESVGKGVSFILYAILCCSRKATQIEQKGILCCTEEVEFSIRNNLDHQQYFVVAQ